MTEEEAEEGITPEIEPSIQLMKITRESNLDPDLANEFRINFEEHFKMANDWSKKAKNIIVTNENQTVLMEQARVARLFIRSKRLEIENFRKSKKEYYLRGGQAIDKVCTLLKNMIEPIENHLDLQEHYIEYKKKAEDERLLADAHAKQEEERIAKEKADAEALKLAQAENEKLRKEQAIKDEENRIKIEEIQRANKLQADKERAEREEIEAELRAKKQAEMLAEANRIKSEERAKSAGDTEKLIRYRAGIKLIIDQFPEIKNKELIRIAEDAKSYLWLAHSTLNQINNEEEE